MYRHGFTGSLVQRGAILLDASPLDLTLFLMSSTKSELEAHIHDSGPT